MAYFFKKKLYDAAIQAVADIEASRDTNLIPHQESFKVRRPFPRLSRVAVRRPAP